MPELTKNSVVDFDNIKRQFDYHGHKPSMIHVKAAIIMAYIHRGLHNCPVFRCRDAKRWEKSFGNPRQAMLNYHGSLATVDMDELTLIVLLAHAMCVRVEIEPNMRHLRLWFHERDASKPGSIMHGHPSLNSLRGRCLDKFWQDLSRLDIAAEWAALGEKAVRP